MENEERIARMLADGVLNRAQAEALRDSLGDGEASVSRDAATAGQWRGFRVAAGLLLFAAVLLLGVLFLAPNEPAMLALAPQDVAATLNEPGGIGQMNQKTSSLLAIALLVLVPLLIWVWLHNSLVSKEEAVFEAWAQTESNLQRRADLIPALIETVSRYLRHESQTLADVTEQRGGASLAAALDELVEAQREAARLVEEQGTAIVEDDADLARLYAAQAQVGARMSSFLAVAESYPELRSADQFLELQAQLEGTENRINVARMRFNEAVSAYNAAIRRLPASLVANAGAFRRKAYFQADPAVREEPEFAFE